VLEKEGLDCEKLGIKFEELESSPNKSLKSLTEGSVLTSVLTGGGGGGKEGTGGKGSKGRTEGSGRSKSGSKSACCNLEDG